MRVIHIVGAPGAGKTYLAEALAEQLGVPRYAIDEERAKLLRPGQHWPDDDGLAWDAIRKGIDKAPVAIVESYGATPKAYQALLGHEVTVVHVKAPRTLRQQRIQQRALSGGPLVGNPLVYIDRLRRLPEPIIDADTEWPGTEPASGSRFDTLVDHLRR